jgi:hypothetical protein
VTRILESTTPLDIERLLGIQITHTFLTLQIPSYIRVLPLCIRIDVLRWWVKMQHLEAEDEPGLE